MKTQTPTADIAAPFNSSSPSTVQNGTLTTAEAREPNAPIAQRELQNLAAQLNRHQGAIPVETLEAYVSNLHITLPDIFDLLQFDPARYTRTRIYHSEACEVLLFVWLPGQRSRIHDHSGSACAVRVVSGHVTETRYEQFNGEVHPAGTTVLPEGSVTCSFDDDIHRVSNEDDAGRILVTLHAYSPPLSQFRVYEETTTSCTDKSL